jgi:hypothetical protein
LYTAESGGQAKMNKNEFEVQRLKKSVLDDHRDKLFDLRDELRTTFVERGWDMNAPIYKRLRDLINGYLRFTERYSFFEFTFLEHRVRNSGRLSTVMAKQLAREFKTVDRAQQEFVAEFRQKSVRVMMSYMIMGSGPLLLATLILTPVVAIASLVMYLMSLVHASGKTVVAKTDELGGVLLALLRVTVATVASKLLFEPFVEEYSYRQA